MSRMFKMSTYFFMLIFVLLSAKSQSVEIVESQARDINGVHGNTPIVSQAGHVFVCYIDGSLNVEIAHKTPSGTWDSPVLISTGNADDTHNFCSLGIDVEGYIHVSYDEHSSGLNYKRSVGPYSVANMVTATSSMPVPANAEISYPEFVRTGRNLETLLFLFRNGSSGNGDECLNRYDEITFQWVSVACPMIKGKDTVNPSSPYLSPPRVDSLGNLQVIYTNRIGYYNFGLYLLTYDAAVSQFKSITGSALSMPLTLSSPGDAVLSQSSKVSNVGLNIAPSLGTIAYLREINGTYEVYTAKYSSGVWTHRQLSRERKPVLDSCPSGSGSGLRPCNMQVTAPSLITSTGGVLTVLYGTAVADSRGSWTRPVSEIHTSTSWDSGTTWSQPATLQSMPPKYCELSSDTLSQYTLAQDCTSESGPLEMWSQADFTALLASNLEEKFRADLYNLTSPVEAGDVPTFILPVVIDLDLYPYASTQPMGVVDKSYGAGQKEIRVVLWGDVIGGVFSYSPDKMQIAVGNSAGDWSLLWYPQVQVSPYSWTRLRITYDGTYVRLYREGVLVAETPYSDSIKNTDIRLIIGGVRSSSNTLVRPYTGHLSVIVH